MGCFHVLLARAFVFGLRTRNVKKPLKTLKNLKIKKKFIQNSRFFQPCICCLYDAQQQTHRMPLLLSNDGTDRQTDGRTIDRFIDPAFVLLGLNIPLFYVHLRLDSCD